VIAVPTALASVTTGQKLPRPVQEQLDRLSLAQRPAALDLGHTAIIAGPGSGKTTTMVAKAAYLIALHGPKAVAMTTFTNAATREMRNRLEAVVGKDGVRGLLISTLHGAMRQTLKKDRALSRRALMGEHEAKLVQRRIVARLFGAEPDKAFAEEVLNAMGRLRSRYPRRTEPLSDSQADTIAAAVLAEYVSYLERENKFDLDELLKLSVESLVAGNSRPLDRKFLIVDEYQDTDETQHAWVKLHADAGCIVTIVGDDDQSIYGFRGSIGYRSMADFIASYKPACYEVTTTYRTAPVIMRAATNVIRHNRERLDKAVTSAVVDPPGTFDTAAFASGNPPVVNFYRMQADGSGFIPLSPDGSAVQAAPGDNGNCDAKDAQEASDKDRGANLRSSQLEAVTAVLTVYDRIQEGGGTGAILGRNNADLDLVEAMARAYRIPFYRPGSRSALSPEIVTGVTALLEAGYLPPSPERITRILDLVGFPAAEIDGVYQFMSSLAAAGNDDFLAHFYDPALYDQIDNVDDRTRLRHVRDLLLSWSDASLTYGRCASGEMESEFLALLEDVRAFVLSSRRAGEKIRYQIDLLFNMVAKSSGDIRERVQKMHYLLRKSERQEDEPQESAIYLGTLHSAKGLEFDSVWMIRASDRRTDDAEEERRLFYVGMTRAKTYLCISTSAVAPVFSPFVDESINAPNNDPAPALTAE
jgi:superfamily I DNA/RNA helicase